MLFNSYVFLFAFLPLTLAVFHGLRRYSHFRAARLSLAIASLGFYGWWSIQGLALLLLLMAANYAVVLALLNLERSKTARLALAIIGIAANLGVLGYFKYANFFIENLAALTGSQAHMIAVILPLGLSFFTFQKIALIADAYGGKVEHIDPIGYVLFVSFFPQLIAGPIVHHSEVMPQFASRLPIRADDVARGVSLFIIGLSKKVLLADNLAEWVTPAFNAAGAGHAPAFASAWIGALSYTLQLYFDFSGYSDMALGLGLLFGIRLPVNFASPYKANGIIEFWRRWHITLSRFLRVYLYIPLGGNRQGQVRAFTNMMATMMLGGLWHGAAWTFVLWGMLHGIYLVINHQWQSLAKVWKTFLLPKPATVILSRMTTFLAVVVGWVFFRAADLNSATAMLSAMTGLSGTKNVGPGLTIAIPILAILMAVVWVAPNSYEMVIGTDEPSQGPSKRIFHQAMMRPVGAAVSGILFIVCIMSLTRATEFLYFQF